MSSNTHNNPTPTPDLPNVATSTEDSTSTVNFGSPISHPVTRSRKALENKEHASKHNSRKRKHWQSLADDPANHNTVQSKPKKKNRKSQDVKVAKEKSPTPLSLDVDEKKESEDQKESVNYDEEEEDLWKYFDEPEWQGILDLVP